MYVTPSRELVDFIHKFVIEKYGGSDGILNEGSLESALYAPEASFAGQELYDTDLKKCCKLFHAIVSNHGYQDGNKRVGVIMFLYELDECHIDTSKITNQFVYHAALMIASGKLSVEKLYNVLNSALKIDN